MIETNGFQILKPDILKVMNSEKVRFLPASMILEKISWILDTNRPLLLSTHDHGASYKEYGNTVEEQEQVISTKYKHMIALEPYSSIQQLDNMQYTLQLRY